MDRQEVVSSLGGVSLSQHLTHTFLWMTAGLAVTANCCFSYSVQRAVDYDLFVLDGAVGVVGRTAGRGYFSDRQAG